ALIPLAGDLGDDFIGAVGIEPEQLDGVGAAHLHLESATGLSKLEPLLAVLGGRDETEADLGDVGAGLGRLDGGNGAGNHGRMATVKLRSLEETLGLAHASFYRF